MDPDCRLTTNFCDVIDELSEGEHEEEIDPRIQGELDTLNSASSEINTLETELEKSRNKFRLLLADSTQQLNALFKKLGKCVLKARPYYELLKRSKEAQSEAQNAAVNFQRSNSIYKAAKEMVQLAEERNFPEDGDRRQLDSAWQEMLNHATMKFMESETEKTQSEEEHFVKSAEYAAITEKLRFYEKDMPRFIKKAKYYFDLKDHLEQSLQGERMNVEDLQMGLVCAKHKYRSALTNLEGISNEIHRKRRHRLELPLRTPGVGAESNSDLSSLPSINLDNLSDTMSFVSGDDLEAADGASLRDDVDWENPAPVPVPDLACTMKELAISNQCSNSTPIEAREEIAEGSESSPDCTHQEVPPVVRMKCDSEHGIPSVRPSEQGIPSSSVRPSQAKQKKFRTEMEFPILQGLTAQQPVYQQNTRGGYPVYVQAPPSSTSQKHSGASHQMK